MNDIIHRQKTINEWKEDFKKCVNSLDDIPWDDYIVIMQYIDNMPSVQQEYKPVKIKDFAKTMSENTIYNFMTWTCEALDLMERQGFVICKKTM